MAGELGADITIAKRAGLLQILVKLLTMKWKDLISQSVLILRRSKRKQGSFTCYRSTSGDVEPNTLIGLSRTGS